MSFLIGASLLLKEIIEYSKRDYSWLSNYFRHNNNEKQQHKHKRRRLSIFTIDEISLLNRDVQSPEHHKQLPLQVFILSGRI